MQTSGNSEHDLLMQCTVAEMKRQNMSAIKADHLPDYVQPDQLGDYIPDATGYYNGSLVIVEAESSEGLLTDHTTDQWRAFFQSACQCGGFFIVAVAHQNEDYAKVLLRLICGSASNVLLWAF